MTHSATRSLALVTALALSAVGLSACANPFEQQTVPVALVGTTEQAADSGDASLTEPTLAVDPDASQKAWRPDEPIVVSAVAGTLSDVTVTDDDGDTLAGALSTDKLHWQSTGTLTPATTYRVRADLVGSAGTEPTTKTVKVTTMESAEEFRALVSPRAGATVGVGMPLRVTFTAPVEKKYRADVERALNVTDSKDSVGAWNWYSSTLVVYRTQHYWPAHSKVTLEADLDGVQASEDVWGDQDRTVTFSIGTSMVSVVDVTTHEMTVTIDGKLARTLPVTTGKAGYLTRGGTRVISEMNSTMRMDAASTGVSKDDPEYYNLPDVRYAMRMTNSGEFVHAAPWSVASQGVANVSHGCVGLSTANAKWLFDRSTIGDIITIKNSTRPLESGNGWTEWNVSWADWKAGSALS